MMDLGKYAVPVLTAYGLTIVLLLGVIVQTVIANAKARRALQEHENHG